MKKLKTKYHCRNCGADVRDNVEPGLTLAEHPGPYYCSTGCRYSAELADRVYIMYQTDNWDRMDAFADGKCSLQEAFRVPYG